MIEEKEVRSNKYLNICIILMMFLLASAYMHSLPGYYDHDEVGHYITLKSMDKNMWFSPWHRAGFKALYFPVRGLDLHNIRLLNLLLIGICCFLLYKISNIVVPLVFLTFPLIQQIGICFYSEIPAIASIILAIYLLKKDKLILFALVLSYGVLIRFEIVLMFLPAVYILRKKPKTILFLFVFPMIYYMISIITYGKFTELFHRYFSFAKDLRWKGNDLFHYVKAIISMSGIWGLFAFTGILKSLRDKEGYKFFMATSTIILVIFYSLSYWNKTAFGPIIGIERHILLIAPMVAFFAVKSIEKYKGYLIALALIIVLVLPSLKKDNEISAIEEACNQVKRMKYSKVYAEHGFINYFLKKPINGEDVSRLKNIGKVKKNELMIWENHYAVRKMSLEGLQNEWSALWHKKSNNFIVIILQKK